MRAQMLRKETGTLREETEGVSRSGGGGGRGRRRGEEQRPDGRRGESLRRRWAMCAVMVIR